jgi:hypothetical protein
MLLWWAAIRGALRERLGSARVVVYTAVTGNYDTLPAPAIKVPNWHYLCFTDEPSVTKPGWELRTLPRGYLDPIRRSRLPKILAHHFLFDYDISIWIDGNIGIKGDLAAFCKMAIARTDIAFFRHGEHRPSVAAEIQACLRFKRAPYEVMAQQYEIYREKGFPDDVGIIPEASVIVRRHHRPRVRAAMEEWWVEFLAHSARDQISLPYIIWRNSLAIALLDWNFRESPWFSYRPHAGAKPQPSYSFGPQWRVQFKY